MARPTKLTEAVQQRLCDAIRAGNALDVAALYAGIAPRTFYNWIDRGQAELDRLEADARCRLRDSEAPFVQFLQAVKKARADCEVRNVAIIQKAAAGHEATKTVTRTKADGSQETVTTTRVEYDWKASAWLLERKHPDRWARRDYVKQQSTTFNIDVSQLTDEQLERIAAGENPAAVFASGPGSDSASGEG